MGHGFHSYVAIITGGELSARSFHSPAVAYTFQISNMDQLPFDTQKIAPFLQE